MVLASQGLISFPTAAALVLGENVGTTITAVLASLAANNNARRTAYFHALFNLMGVFYITLLFQPFIGFVEWELGTFFGIKDLTDLSKVSFGIAAVHSTFNIFNTLIFLLPCRLIAQFLESSTATGILTRIKMLSKETEQAPELKALLTMMAHSHSKDSSYVQFIEIETRIQRVLIYTGNQLKTGIHNLTHCIENSDKASPEIDQIFEAEKLCDKVKIEVLSLLSRFVASEDATLTVQQRSFTYERILDNLESVSDYMAQVAKLRLRLLNNKTDLFDYQKQDLLKINTLISNSMDKLLPAVEKSPQRGDIKIANELESDFAAIRDTIRSVRSNFWEMSSNKVTEPIVNDAYSNMLVAYRRVRDHLRSTSNAVFGIDRD
jgi:phosphate:Na+ symporter